MTRWKLAIAIACSIGICTFADGAAPALDLVGGEGPARETGASPPVQTSGPGLIHEIVTWFAIQDALSYLRLGVPRPLVREAVGRLTEIGPPAVLPILSALRDSRVLLNWAQDAIEHMGHDAVPELREVFRKRVRDFGLESAAAKTIAILRPPVAAPLMPVLLERLERSGGQLRPPMDEIARAVERAGSPTDRQKLAQALLNDSLATGDPYTVGTAAELLSDLVSGGALPPDALKALERLTNEPGYLGMKAKTVLRYHFPSISAADVMYASNQHIDLMALPKARLEITIENPTVSPIKVSHVAVYRVTRHGDVLARNLYPGEKVVPAGGRLALNETWHEEAEFSELPGLDQPRYLGVQLFAGERRLVPGGRNSFGVQVTAPVNY